MCNWFDKKILKLRTLLIAMEPTYKILDSKENISLARKRLKLELELKEDTIRYVTRCPEALFQWEVYFPPVQGSAVVALAKPTEEMVETYHTVNDIVKMIAEQHDLEAAVSYPTVLGDGYVGLRVGLNRPGFRVEYAEYIEHIDE